MKIDYIIDKSIPDNLKHNDELRVVNIKTLKIEIYLLFFPNRKYTSQAKRKRLWKQNLVLVEIVFI